MNRYGAKLNDKATQEIRRRYSAGEAFGLNSLESSVSPPLPSMR